jgi:hypothetical protein
MSTTDTTPAEEPRSQIGRLAEQLSDALERTEDMIRGMYKNPAEVQVPPLRTTGKFRRPVDEEEVHFGYAKIDGEWGLYVTINPHREKHLDVLSTSLNVRMRVALSVPNLLLALEESVHLKVDEIMRVTAALQNFLDRVNAIEPSQRHAHMKVLIAAFERDLEEV